MKFSAKIGVGGLFALGLMAVLFATAAPGGSATKDYPSHDYWAGFKEIPSTRKAPQLVNTSRFKKPASKQLVIAFADSSQSNSLRVEAHAAVVYAMSKVKGAKLVYTQADDSAPKQIANIDDMLVQHVDALIISAVDVNAVCPSIDKALAAGVPVIVMERAVNCKRYTSYISMNQVNTAENFMAYIAYRLGGKGEIAIMSGIPGVGHSVETERGFKNILKKYPGIKVVATEYGKYDPATAQQLASAMLVAHPKIAAFASASALMTQGIYRAVANAGKVSQMKAWAGDDNNGWMKFAIKYDLPNLSIPYPVSMGDLAVTVAVDALHGKPVAKINYVKRWAEPIAFSRNLSKYVNYKRTDEWFYNTMPCKFDPFCKK